MKKMFCHSLIGLVLLAAMACHIATKTTATAQVGTIQPASTPVSIIAAPVAWTQKLIDLGTIKKGEKRSTQFEFTNTSGVPLKIYHVDACECTRVEFPRGVIPPGEKRRLDVLFDSEKKDASETISINVFFEKPSAPTDAPMIEVVQYKYEFGTRE